jgi:hypothetical protein
MWGHFVAKHRMLDQIKKIKFVFTKKLEGY